MRILLCKKRMERKKKMKKHSGWKNYSFYLKLNEISDAKVIFFSLQENFSFHFMK